MQVANQQGTVIKRKPGMNNQRWQSRGLQFTRQSILSLADAVVLQSIEDLFSPFFRSGSLTFFNGRGFELCAGVTGMNENQKAGILTMLRQSGFQINCRKVTSRKEN